MKVLIVNNGTKEPALLEAAFNGYDITTVSWNELSPTTNSGFDLIVLSGSSRCPVVGNEEMFSSELELIRSCPVPLLGICLGFELMVVAYGGTLKMLSDRENGILEIQPLQPDPLFAGIQHIKVYEGHRWVADTLPASLIPLAQSKDGIEAIKHTEKLMYGCQFHPEKCIEETEGIHILKNFLTIISHKDSQ